MSDGDLKKTSAGRLNPPLAKGGMGGFVDPSTGGLSRIYGLTANFLMRHRIGAVPLGTLLFICLSLFPGCRSVPPPTLSDSQLKAVELNNRAGRAFKKGKYKSALDFYTEALAISHSIENADGIAANLLNLAAVYRRLGETEEAHNSVDEVLDNEYITFSPEHLSGAAFIKAMLYLDDDEYDRAREMADRSLSFCSDVSCPLEGSIYNLKARLALQKMDPKTALSLGERGIKLNRRYSDEVEIANSLRLIGDAKTAIEEYKEARKFYEEALSIDKRLGLSRKIAADLMGMGDTLFGEGKLSEALAYYRRALIVSENGGDREGVERAEDMIKGCQQY